MNESGVEGRNVRRPNDQMHENECPSKNSHKIPCQCQEKEVLSIPSSSTLPSRLHFLISILLVVQCNANIIQYLPNSVHHPPVPVSKYPRARWSCSCSSSRHC